MREIIPKYHPPTPTTEISVVLQAISACTYNASGHLKRSLPVRDAANNLTRTTLILRTGAGGAYTAQCTQAVKHRLFVDSFTSSRACVHFESRNSLTPRHSPSNENRHRSSTNMHIPTIIVSISFALFASATPNSRRAETLCDDPTHSEPQCCVSEPSKFLLGKGELICSPRAYKQRIFRLSRSVANGVSQLRMCPRWRHLSRAALVIVYHHAVWCPVSVPPPFAACVC
jgi:hypothetical protein